MSQYFVYYTESTIICLTLFGIMLVHDLVGVDRQEKQIKYDHALIAFMLYFLSDGIWASMISGVLPASDFFVYLINLTNYLFMANITYSWYRYVLAVEQVPNRERKLNRLAVMFPYLVSSVILIVIFLISPRALIDENMKSSLLYYAFLIGVPTIYIVAILSYTTTRAVKASNPIEKRRHFFIGIFPLMVVAGGILQVALLPNTPVFCYCCAILMIIFYIQSMDSQISTDPLTGLNNRGQLHRYISQEESLFRDGRKTYVAMLDVNNFKDINDNYGHSQGDLALTMIADVLRAAAAEFKQPVFIGRYGGDEFIIIAHPRTVRDMDSLVSSIRSGLAAECRKRGTPYEITVGIGYDELKKQHGSFQESMEQADRNCYNDKRKIKEGA